MIIEQNTNYAYKLKHIDRPTFEDVRRLSVEFYRSLPQELQDELFEALKRGVDILDKEPQMTAYMFSYGKMHQAKLNYAFSKLSDDFLSQDEINIIDYGCGQALGTMCFADFLHNKDYAQQVKTITLIEPSEICLKRAALHVSVFFPDAEIKTINKKFDDLTQDDIVCGEKTPTLHILSNVLDIMSFDMNKFANLVKGCLKGGNQFLCIGPYFKEAIIDNRIKEFSCYISLDHFYETIDKRKLNTDKDWTCSLSLFYVGKTGKTTTEVFDSDWIDSVADSHSDRRGGIYNFDYSKLLEYKNQIYVDVYFVAEGTKIICDNAFNKKYYDYGNYGAKDSCYLEQIIIPNTVIAIGKGAFGHCDSLIHIAIPNSVKSIGREAFYHCTSLHYIEIPSSISTIEEGLFEECDSLEQVIIPNSVNSIEDDAFYCCSSLRKIDIPDSVTQIGRSAFSGCGSLWQIILPNSITRINKYTFLDCRSLQEIVMPNTIQVIEEDAFAGCYSLNKIIIPKGSKKRIRTILEHYLWDKLIEV